MSSMISSPFLDLKRPLCASGSPLQLHLSPFSISCAVGDNPCHTPGVQKQQQQQQRLHIQAFSTPPTPKGFGPSKKKQRTFTRTLEPAEDGPSKEEVADDVVPEIVTNRMLKRVGFTVGLPLLLGVLSFPTFYYVRVVGSVDVPLWIPFVTSLLTFGSAGIGISYGLLSTSWDPLREGSLLGWEEAKTNWPLIWKDSSKKNEI